MKRGYWFVHEREFSFCIFSPGRDRPNICVEYGDTAYNIPSYGTKAEARADAEFIADALNKRDGLTAKDGQ